MTSGAPHATSTRYSMTTPASPYEVARQAHAFIAKCLGGSTQAELESAARHLRQARDELQVDQSDPQVLTIIASIEHAQRAVTQAQLMLADRASKRG